MLYQMFLVTEDRDTLVGGATLLKTAFWGPGGKDSGRLVQPFHTVMIDDPAEAARLLTHARALTHYRKREPVIEIIEPHAFSSFVTTMEAAVLCAPPTAEALGIKAQTDSMPVFAMPSDRMTRDMYLGHIVNGERGRVSDARFGVDLSELTHILIQGVTGMGKTSTMMRLLEQAVQLQRTVIYPPTAANPSIITKKARAGVLCFDWMQNMRDLARLVEPERFQLFSVSNPGIGEFRWNPLEVPHDTMDAGQWLGAQADNLAASFGLGEVGRSLVAELVDRLYLANRLEPFVLCKEVVDEATGAVLKPAVVLAPVDPATLPAGAIQITASGNREATVYTCPRLSRLVSLEHVAALVLQMINDLATPEGARKMGTEMRNRVQSVWRRIHFYAPGGLLAPMVAADPDLNTRQCLGVRDIIDPDRGLVTIIETDGLDLENRRVILGSVMLAVYRYGLHVGKGAYDHGGLGPGTFLILEEAHELFGAAGESEDRSSATMRANLYESMFRRARATGLRLVAMTQNCGAIPPAITSQTTTVIVHRSYDDEDRKRIFSLLNLLNQIGQSQREWRYLGEMPRGYAIVRLDARDSYLDSAPVQILIDPPSLVPVGDAELAALASARTVHRSA
jgi:DNA helicase HerA-like ATPase